MTPGISVPIQSGPPYDWRKSVLSGLRAAGATLLGIAWAGAVEAVIHGLSDPAVVSGLLVGLAKENPWVLLLGPIIAGAVKAWDNRRKNKPKAPEPVVHA